MRLQWFWLLSVCALWQFANCSCPPRYDLVSDGKCFGRVTLALDVCDNTAINTAISICNDTQAQVASVHSDYENSYLANLVTSGSNGVVLGLVCDAPSKKWVWSDGSALDYKPAVYKAELNDDCAAGCVWFVWKNGGNWQMWCDRDWSNFDIVCTTQLPPQPAASANGCDNFDVDKDNGVCYQVGKTAVNWQEAQLVCQSFGASVASIHNDKENSFVRRMAVSKGAVKGVFLGANMTGKGSEFGWIDGSKWDYDNYFLGFPKSGFGDCLSMDTSGSSGQWVNVDCSTEMSVACMKQQHYTPPACSSGPWVEGQIIYSPGYPYDSSIPCDFMFSVDAGKKVQLEVLSLEANMCCDHLTINEDYFGGTVIADLSGEISDKTYTTSSSNFMRVSWLPNGGTNVKGAIMTFRGV